MSNHSSGSQQIHHAQARRRLNLQRLQHAKGFFEMLPINNVGFDCECSHANCDAIVSIPSALYESIHRWANRFTVWPGHEQPDHETVIEKYFDFMVIEKPS
jgi:hypothetical protein